MRLGGGGEGWEEEVLLIIIICISVYHKNHSVAFEIRCLFYRL